MTETSEKTVAEETTVTATGLDGVISIALSQGALSIWYVPIGAILLLLLMPHWHHPVPEFSARLAYAAVFALALLIPISWLVNPGLPKAGSDSS